MRCALFMLLLGTSICLSDEFTKPKVKATKARKIKREDVYVAAGDLLKTTNKLHHTSTTLNAWCIDEVEDGCSDKKGIIAQASQEKLQRDYRIMKELTQETQLFEQRIQQKLHELHNTK